MLKRLLFTVLGVVALLVCIAAGLLVAAHIAIRQERTALPSAAAIVAPAAGERPVRVWVVNTASQRMPRSAVLDAGRDPRSTEPYVMSHPSFLIEWQDGRFLMVDAGMDRAQALALGPLIETMSGGDPIEPHGSVAEQLGEARNRVRGLIFTHLHADHVGGITELCEQRPQALRVFMNMAQATDTNFATRSALKTVRAASGARIQVMANAGLAPLPGFPGVGVIHAGGHTPGSQIIVADVKTRAGRQVYAFVGDIANNIDGVSLDIPKPLLYSLFIVPEDRSRLSELRALLRELRERYGVVVLLSHDQLQIEQAGLARWRP